MAISTPYKYDPPTNIADWLEFHCLASDSKKAMVIGLVGAMELDMEYELEDIGEEDAQNEAIVAQAVEAFLGGKERIFIGQARILRGVFDLGGGEKYEPLLHLFPQQRWQHLRCLIYSD